MKNRGAAIFLCMVLFLSSMAVAQWSIEIQDEPISLDKLSNETETKQIVEITDSNDQPIDNQEMQESTLDPAFTYNHTNDGDADEIEGEMEHLVEGYWYADFEPVYDPGMIMYRLDDSSINETEEIDIGNLTVDLQTDLSGKHTAGSDKDFRVEVMNEWFNSIVDEEDGNVDVYFTNGTWTSSSHRLGYSQDDEVHHLSINLPEKSNTTYVAHIEAEGTNGGYDNPFGSTSVIVETYPSVEGEIAVLEAGSGCEDPESGEQFFTECERDTEIDTEFEITASEAEKVELDVILEELETGEWVEEESIELSEEEENIWEGSFTFPDVNVSEYKDRVTLRYNATNDDRQDIATWNVTSRSYDLDDRGSAKAYQGDDYEVRLLFSKYVSGESLNSTRFKNASIEINDSDGSQFDSFNLDDMEYNENLGLFTNPVNIPSDAEPGSYSLDVVAYNNHLERKTLGSTFKVEDIEATFNITEDIDFEANKSAVYNRNVTLESRSSSDRTIETEVSEDISDIVEVNEGEVIELPGDGDLEVPVEFNVTSVDIYTGEITLMDADVDYEDTIDVVIDAPSCDVRNGTLCLTGEETWVNVTREERGHITRYADLIYLGENDTTTSISTEVTGDVSSYLELVPSSFDLDHVNDTQQVTMNYSFTAPGNFTGEIMFENGGDELRLNTDMESEVESTETGLDTTGSIDLGYLPSGSSETREIDVENTGEVEITELEVSSIEYSVSTDSVSVTAGETESVELSFTDIDSESGTVTVTAVTDFGDVEEDISVSADPVPDYSQQADTLSTRITDLERSTDDEELLSDLESLQIEVSDVTSEYNQENYEEAEQIYNRISGDVDRIESQITRGPGDGETEGGIPFLPIIAAVFVLILAGFVAYTSIIPEEGDPLYNSGG